MSSVIKAIMLVILLNSFSRFVNNASQHFDSQEVYCADRYSNLTYLKEASIDLLLMAGTLSESPSS